MHTTLILEPQTIRTGVVYVEKGYIFYEPPQGKKLQISLQDIALIGEYTINNHALHKGAWNLVFVLKNSSWESIPWFTENMQSLSAYLSYTFKTSFDMAELPKTISGTSLIRYPEALKGKPLFQITPPKEYRPLSNTWQQLRYSLLSALGKNKWVLQLTDEVKVYLLNSH